MTRDAGTLQILETPADVARALAQTFVDTGSQAIRERGSFSVALAGGSTPKAAYALLAQPPFSNAVDWNKVEIFFGDERCVPPEDEQSNFRTANLGFLHAVGVPAEHIHRMRGEVDPAAAAAAYRDELTTSLGPQPCLDLVMLGMGPDGHTASLFPGTDPLTDAEALVRAVYAPSQSQWRITLTPAVINAARNVIFAVEGAGKAATLKAVREGSYQPATYPSQIVAPLHGTLTWLVDRAATAQ